MLSEQGDILPIERVSVEPKSNFEMAAADIERVATLIDHHISQFRSEYENRRNNCIKAKIGFTIMRPDLTYIKTLLKNAIQSENLSKIQYDVITPESWKDKIEFKLTFNDNDPIKVLKMMKSTLDQVNNFFGFCFRQSVIQVDDASTLDGMQLFSTDSLTTRDLSIEFVNGSPILEIDESKPFIQCNIPYTATEVMRMYFEFITNFVNQLSTISKLLQILEAREKNKQSKEGPLLKEREETNS